MQVNFANTNSNYQKKEVAFKGLPFKLVEQNLSTQGKAVFGHVAELEQGCLMGFLEHLQRKAQAVCENAAKMAEGLRNKDPESSKNIAAMGQDLKKKIDNFVGSMSKEFTGKDKPEGSGFKFVEKRVKPRTPRDHAPIPKTELQFVKDGESYTLNLGYDSYSPGASPSSPANVLDIRYPSANNGAAKVFNSNTLSERLLESPATKDAVVMPGDLIKEGQVGHHGSGYFHTDKGLVLKFDDQFGLNKITSGIREALKHEEQLEASPLMAKINENAAKDIEQAQVDAFKV